MPRDLEPATIERLIELGIVAEGARLSSAVLADLAAFVDGEPTVVQCRAEIVDEPLATLRAIVEPIGAVPSVAAPVFHRRALRTYRAYRTSVGLDELFVSTPAVAV